MSTMRVRPAQPADAAILAEMANDLNDHVGIHGRPFTPETIRADGFGPRPAFRRWWPKWRASWSVTPSSP
jgi:hypothetical protein